MSIDRVFNWPLKILAILLSPIITVVYLGYADAVARDLLNQIDNKSSYSPGDIHVSQFGAKCDGRTDDSSAFNAAFKELRDQLGRSPSFTGTVMFPSGNCIIRSSINLTMIRSKSIVIDGAGSRIIGKTGGSPVIDAMGTRQIKFKNLTINGDVTSPPSYGMQIGRIDNTERDSSDSLIFENLSLDGSFSKSALINLNSETSTFIHPILVNENEDASSFVLILDGSNHHDVKSEFVRIAQPVDNPQSFNENLFVNADIRHNQGGTPIWVSNTNKLSFIRSYASTARGLYGIVFHISNPRDAITLTNLDVHFEGSKLKNIINISSWTNKVNLSGLDYIDQYAGASEAIIGSDSGVSIATILDMRFRISACRTGSAVLSSDIEWMTSGYLYLGRGCKFDSQRSSFSGILDNEGWVSFHPRSKSAR